MNTKPSRKSGPRQSPRAVVSKDGQAVGVWLVDRAPHVLLAEYGNRKTSGKESLATQRFEAVMQSLRNSLGPVANDPAVVEALHKLDGAVWDCAVEHEDRAWYAAWTLAMSLKGGR